MLILKLLRCRPLDNLSHPMMKANDRPHPRISRPRQLLFLPLFILHPMSTFWRGCKHRCLSKSTHSSEGVIKEFIPAPECPLLEGRTHAKRQGTLVVRRRQNAEAPEKADVGEWVRGGNCVPGAACLSWSWSPTVSSVQILGFPVPK